LSVPNRLQDGRLEALHATRLLDTPAEQAFDRFSKLATQVLGVPVALVSLVDADRQFFKSQTGLPEPWATVRETPLSHSFCKHVVENRQPLVVVDAREHPLLRDNLAVRDFGVVAYLGVPLTTADGHTLGSLCAIDTSPRVWTEDAIAILRDLAAFAMTEIELRLTVRESQARYAQLQTLELQRAELVDMLVHDLRNPLTSLIGGLDLVASTEGLSQVIQEDIALARDGADALVRMVSEILDVSKAEAGQLGLTQKEWHPSAIVRDAVQQLIHLARGADIHLRSDVAPGLPIMIADGVKLRRVLVNLLANAIQHTPAHGEIVVSAEPSGDGASIRFSVADTGCGIAPSAIGKLFEKFGSRTDLSSERTSTGLGLPFCKLVAEAHGGRISVRSTPGQGTIFEVAIPLGGLTR
jgi:signal transduction histidine kinase